MRTNEFVCHSVDLLYYELHKINLNRGGSNIDCPKCIKNKKVTTNIKNNDDKCFQYAVTVALNFKISKAILKEYQTLSLLLIIIIGKK